MTVAFVIMIAVAATPGLINGLLVRYGGFTAVAATLTLYIGLRGVSLLLRPFQGGYISTRVTDLIIATVGYVPIAFIVAVVVAVGLEVALRTTPWGRGLRAVGSHEDSAYRLGIKVNRTHVLAYVACALLTFVGALLLMAQIGVGDPHAGRDVHAVQHHGRGARWRQPAGRAWLVRRHPARSGADPAGRWRESDRHVPPYGRCLVLACARSGRASRAPTTKPITCAG